MKDLDQILKYYRGELNNAERQAFLKKCKDDPDFAKEVKIFYLTADRHTALKGEQLHKDHLKRKKKKRFIFLFLFFLIIIISLLFALKSIYPFEKTGNPIIQEIDTDADGISDKKDQCPFTYGTIANNGCPEIKKEDTLTPPIVIPPIDIKEEEINNKPSDNKNDTKPDLDIKPSKELLIFADQLPSNSTILKESIKIKVMGGGWKGKIENGQYDDALVLLNKELSQEETLNDAEDILLYYTGILELYQKKNYSRSTTLLSTISDDKGYIKLSKLHLFISYIRQEKNNEAKVFYMNNKVILDEFKSVNKYNISDLIEELIN